MSSFFKEYKILIIILLVVLVIAISIGLFYKNFSDNIKNTEDTMEKISKTYLNVESSISDYNKIRDDLSVLIDSYYTEKLGVDYGTYIDLLKKEEAIINNIKIDINTLSSNCQNRIFNDSKINKICNSYGDYYETVVNIYVKDTMQVNEMINVYNSTFSDTFEEYSSSYKEFIDYNNDGNYLERD